MLKILIGLAVIGCLLAGGCMLLFSKKIGYHVEGDSAYYYFVGYSDWKQKRKEITGADVTSLKETDSEYTTDDQHAFYRGTLLQKSDASTFRIVDKYTSLSRDASNIWSGSTLVSEDADHYKVLKDFHAKDRFKVYHFGKVLDGADPATFEMLGDVRFVARDKTRAYMRGKIIEHADGPTFRHIGHNFFVDKARVWFFGSLIDGADPGSFELLNDRYSKDDKRAYYTGDPIEGADPKSFRVTSTEPGKYTAEDAKYKYKEGKRVN